MVYLLLALRKLKIYYYYHFDGLSSFIALTDANGAFIEYYEYDVYGAPTIRDLNGTILDTSQFGNPYMFTGRRFDDETGLYYNSIIIAMKEQWGT